LDATNNELTKQSAVVVERLKHIKPGENAFTANLPEHLQLNVSGAKISQIYKRLRADKPSYTITGSGGGGTHVYHWSEPRALTNRERARLQTFPDNFEFLGTKESVRKQIGMAVPVEGAQVVFELPIDRTKFGFFLRQSIELGKAAVYGGVSKRRPV
jgi:DNA (cytosine-5)-methyltransferase 1